MATLRDTLRANQRLVRGPGGQLAAQSTPGPEQDANLKQLAGQAGLQAPPVTPLGAMSIGANPDQAKMAGTPTQKQGALSQAIQGSSPTEGLAGAVRQAQTRSQTTQAEQQGIQKSADMQNLGGLGDRVNDFINAQRQNLATEAGKGVDVQTAQVLSGNAGQTAADPVATKDLLGQLRADPTNQDLMLKVNQALGYNISTQLAPAQIDQLYESAVDSIARGGAGDVADKLTVDDLVNMPSFGYDRATLSSLLEIPEAQLAGMTVAQIRTQIDKVGQQEFSKSQELGQQAQSGLLGQAERGQAQLAGRELSQTGVRASEANYQQLENQISNADQVTFNGQKYAIEDLLKDETISGIISGLMAAGPDSQTWRDALKSEPELMRFITENQAVLTDASTKLQAGAQQFTDTQTFNKGLLNSSGIQLSDTLGKLIVPQAYNLSAGKVDPKSVPLLRYISEVSPEEANRVVNEANSYFTAHPEKAEEFSKLSQDQMNTMDMRNPNSVAWNTYKSRDQFYNSVKNLDPSNVDLLATSAFSGVLGAQDLIDKTNQLRGQNVLGFGNANAPDLSNVMTDGKIDGNKLKAAILAANPEPSLTDFADGHAVAVSKPSISSPASLEPIQASILQKLGKAAATGSVNDKQILGANLNLDELIYLQDHRNGKVDYRAVDLAQSLARGNNTQDALKAVAGNWDDQMTQLQKLIGSDSRHIDRAPVQARITELANQRLESELEAAARDRDKGRTRMRQNRQLVAIAYPWFAALPQDTQDQMINTAAVLGKTGLDEWKKIDYDPNRTAPENLAIAARQLSTGPYRAALASSQQFRQLFPDIAREAVGDLGKAVSGEFKSALGYK